MESAIAPESKTRLRFEYLALRTNIVAALWNARLRIFD